MKTSLLVLSALCVAGCTGKSLDVGDVDQNGAANANPNGNANGNANADGGATQTDGGTDTPVPATDAQLTELAKQCNLAHGAPVTVDSAATFNKLISHRWFRCGPEVTTSSFYHRSPGLELTSDGKWFQLENATGAWLRSSAPSGTGAWKLNDVVDRYDSILIDYDGSTAGDRVEFEVDPFRMKVTEIQTSNGLVTWFVPF